MDQLMLDEAGSLLRRGEVRAAQTALGSLEPEQRRLALQMRDRDGNTFRCPVGTPRGLSLNLVAPYLEAPPGTRNGGR